jgi:two-component system copper resistance phosphate regulon response regulator CusR
MPQEVTTRHRVLIVDDEESMRLLLARILSTELKVEVQLAGTCEQALRLADSYAYDAILLDLLMPGIGGFGVLSEIRASSSPNAATPVIMVSVVSEQDTIDRCIAAGANAYLVKPVKRAELADTVKAQLAARRKTKTLAK